METNKELLDIWAIRTDGGTQVRAGLDTDAAIEYGARIKAGESLPPVVVFRDEEDRVWLADGFHRVIGSREAGCTEISAVVNKGTRRDALLYAISANINHGVRLTNAEKRNSVQTLLEDPEWSQWSDREIARCAGVSHTYVSRLREQQRDQQREQEQQTGNVATVEVEETPSADERFSPRDFLLGILDEEAAKAEGDRFYGIWLDPFEGKISGHIKQIRLGEEKIPEVAAAWEAVNELRKVTSVEDWWSLHETLPEEVEELQLRALTVSAELLTQAREARDQTGIDHATAQLLSALLAAVVTSMQWTQPVPGMEEIVGTEVHRLRYKLRPRLTECFYAIDRLTRSYVPHRWFPFEWVREERDCARQLEWEIEHDSLELGEGLLRLFEGDGWKALGHGSWAEYVQAKFKMSEEDAHGLIEAAAQMTPQRYYQAADELRQSALSMRQAAETADPTQRRDLEAEAIRIDQLVEKNEQRAKQKAAR